MKLRLPFAAGVALALFTGLLAESALAQRGARQGKTKRDPQTQGQTPQQDGPGPAMRGGPGKAFRGGRGGLDMPGPLIERLRQMPPERRERFFQNNRIFQSMPPEEQARIRENLRRWDALSPQQRRELLRRNFVWQQMSPEQRQRVREEILPRWQQLAPERRQAIERRLRALGPLSDEEREARLKDESFLRGLSVEDQELLRELSRLRLGAAERPEPPQPEPPPA